MPWRTRRSDADKQNLDWRLSLGEPGKDPEDAGGSHYHREDCTLHLTSSGRTVRRHNLIQRGSRDERQQLRSPEVASQITAHPRRLKRVDLRLRDEELPRHPLGEVVEANSGSPSCVVAAGSSRHGLSCAWPYWPPSGRKSTYHAVKIPRASAPDRLDGDAGHAGQLEVDAALQRLQKLLMIGSGFPYSEFLPEPGKAKGVQIDILIWVRYRYAIRCAASRRCTGDPALAAADA